MNMWMIDFAAVRATRASSGAGEKGAEEPIDHALGRSRGSLATKFHLVCDANGISLCFLLSPGQASDITHAQPFWIRFVSPETLGGLVNAAADCWMLYEGYGGN